VPKPSIYTKLTPANRRLFGHSRLWLAPDHILLLESTWFNESYKRFAVSEIQSIVVTESEPPIVLQIVMILAALAWMTLWFAATSKFAKWSFAVTGGLALIWPVVDWARGPRCRCMLHTRVTDQWLEPVSRIRIADHFLGIVRPMIEAVQGGLPVKFTLEGAHEFGEQADQAPPPTLFTSPSYLPEILFGLFLIDAVLIWATAHYPKVQDISAVLLNLLGCEVLLIPIVLIRRKGRDSRLIVYVVIALAIIGLAFDFRSIGSSFVGWYLTVLDKAKAGNRSATFVELFPLGADAVISYSWRLAAGVIGLAAAFYERRRPLQ